MGCAEQALAMICAEAYTQPLNRDINAEYELERCALEKGVSHAGTVAFM